MTTIRVSDEGTVSIKIGGGFMSLLCLLFIALKLANVITWSWFWVLAPILWPFYLIWWIVVACFYLVIAMILIVAVGALVAKLYR